MSSAKFVKPLCLDLRPSRSLLYLVSVLHAGALPVLIPLSLSWQLKLLLALIVAVSYLVALNRTGWLVAKSGYLPFVQAPVTQLVWQQDGSWLLITASGKQPACLRPSSTVNAVFVALNFRLEDAPWYCSRRSLWLLSDSADAGQLRQLRVRLLAGG